MMDKIADFLQKFFSRMAIPSVRPADIIEILLLAILPEEHFMCTIVPV